MLTWWWGVLVGWCSVHKSQCGLADLEAVSVQLAWVQRTASASAGLGCVCSYAMCFSVAATMCRLFLSLQNSK